MQTFEDVNFIIPGKPSSWKRVRVGRGEFFNSDKMTAEQRIIGHYAMRAMRGRQLLKGPIRIEIKFTFKTPTKAKIGKLHTARPDIDNLIKQIMDSCNKVVYHDDAQVCYIECSKRYGEEASTEVVMWESLT